MSYSLRDNDIFLFHGGESVTWIILKPQSSCMWPCWVWEGNDISSTCGYSQGSKKLET